MKKFLPFLFFIFSLPVFAQVEKALPPKPNPPRLYNDFTRKFLTAEQATELERKLVAYDDSTSNQLAIVVVDDLKGYSAADFAIALGRTWGVGNKKTNNGVVLLVSTGGGDGNRDVFIAPGYGLEGAIPDIIAKAIIDNEIIPNFKEGNFYRGLDEASDAIIKAAQGRYQAPQGYSGRGKKGLSPVAVLVVVVIFLVIMGSIRGGGGGGGGYVSRRGYRGWPAGWIGGGWLGGGGWSGGGGGGGWSGGGGGGGFGGFGGGGFGGGGAGGKW